MTAVKDRVALVTGANRGLGYAFCEGLLDAGVRKIYAGTRNPSKVFTGRPKIESLKLDVTSFVDIQAAAVMCTDVDLLINNAGVLRNSSVLADEAEAAARIEMETNFFGALSLVRAFAPILAKNGGGAIVNILSVASWFGNPFMATYCASKAAEMALTNAVRIELRSQNTQVIGVYAGYLDTEMAAHVNSPKTSTVQVVSRTLNGLEEGAEHILADDRACNMETLVRTDPARLYSDLQRQWDES